VIRLGLATIRARQVGFLLLLCVAVAQAGYWIFDQVSFTREAVERIARLHEAERDAVRRLIEAGVDPAPLAPALPHLDLGGPDGVDLRPGVVEGLREAARRRVNRYVWEGVFFLTVLLAGMGVLAGAIRQDRVLRDRQRNFIAAVSHELKSPLASLRLSVETLALRDPAGDARHRLVARMLRDLDRLQDTVSNILDTARVEQGRLALERQLVTLAREAERVAQDYRAQADLGGVEVRNLIPEHATAHADPIAVRTVLRNLLDNALKATIAAGGGTVTISAREETGQVTVTVRDTGIGFEPGEAHRLFERFYRPGNELRRETRGTGLGLYLVKQLVELGGGRAGAESAGRGRGAAVHVSWPVPRETR
jgi:signal transduction histidine kinase